MRKAMIQVKKYQGKVKLSELLSENEAIMKI